MAERKYVAIDLKSFYASVECVDRGLDALDALLVVADEERTDKTICLAVSPALKSFGIPGRARLFEVKKAVRDVNARRRALLKGKPFKRKTTSFKELASDAYAELDFIVAEPRMSRYTAVSGEIYEIYKEFVSPFDTVVYSVDEVFIDLTDYIKLYSLSARALTSKMISRVFEKTGVTATAGIGDNLYLAKIALDIEAKKIKADSNGARIAELTVASYREKMWAHEPITDFWRVGKGYAKKLAAYGMKTMGDVALKSTYAEDTLYKLFGVNAELLIDHAWGYEPTEIKDIKEYKPENNSISSGQVLKEPYPYEKVKLIVKEMAEQLSFSLVEKKLNTAQIVLTVVYDVENASDGGYDGQVVTDAYGRVAPKPARGTENLGSYVSSTELITQAFIRLLERIYDKNLTARKLYLVAEKVLSNEESEKREISEYEQLDIFSDPEKKEEEKRKKEKRLKKERKRQEAVVAIRKKYGKNSLVMGMNLQEGATGVERNGTIGGHKA